MEDTAKALLLIEEARQKKDYGDIFGAIAAYTQSIQQDPNHADAYLERGRILLAMGDKQNAMKDMMDAVRLRPDLVEGRITNK